MSYKFLSEKDPAEIVTLTFDFSLALDTGETITAIDSVTVELVSGVDPSPSAILTGTAAVSLSGVSVAQPVQGGVDCADYSVKVLVSTSNAYKKLALAGILRVRNQ